MQFPMEFFRDLVVGAIVLAALGATLLAVLFLVDVTRRRLW